MTATSRAETQPVITLTTDFGTGSPYVAVMKAKLLAGCPGALLLDVSHSVPPFDLYTAAFLLWAGTHEFAPGTVHLAVVDPGVGGSRRALALQLGGSWYVGPDNGIFTDVLAEAGTPAVALELERQRSASPTFEGRDVFAPAAAALAAGRSSTVPGRAARGQPVRLPARPPCVLWVDNFGNLVTSLRPPVRSLLVNGREIRETAVTYSQAPTDSPFIYVGSLGLIEVGVPRSRADQRLGAGPGSPVEAL